VRYSTQIKPISDLKANAAEVLRVLEQQRTLSPTVALTLILLFTGAGSVGLPVIDPARHRFEKFGMR